MQFLLDISAYRALFYAKSGQIVTYVKSEQIMTVAHCIYLFVSCYMPVGFFITYHWLFNLCTTFKYVQYCVKFSTRRKIILHSFLVALDFSAPFSYCLGKYFESLYQSLVELQLSLGNQHQLIFCSFAVSKMDPSINFDNSNSNNN